MSNNDATTTPIPEKASPLAAKRRRPVTLALLMIAFRPIPEKASPLAAKRRLPVALALLMLAFRPIPEKASPLAAKRRLPVALALLMLALWPARSSADVLIAFLPGQDAGLTPPTYALDPRPVSIDAAALLQVERFAPVEIQVGEAEFVTLQAWEVTSHRNADRTISARGAVNGAWYSLTLTAGQHNLFGHLSTSDGIYQIYAIGSRDAWVGWMYRSGALTNGHSAFHNDFVIPDIPVDRLDAAELPVLPLQTDGSDPGGNDATAAGNAGINAANFHISQQFSRNPVIVGASVDARALFENISDQWHRGLVVDFYFLLENTRLLHAPDYCHQQLSLTLQTVLRCELGDFAPGESRSFIYSVATSEESRPWIFSTAIVGNLRIDSIVNVVDDVRTDSDGDGISDFNELLTETDPFDPDSVDLRNTVIDVMAFYTAGAEARYPNGVETRINQLISVANQVYRDSGVSLTLRPVYHGRVDYNDVDDMDAALNHIIYKTDPAFAEVDELRARYGGDLVMLFRPLAPNASRCGLATVGGFNTHGDFTAPTERDFAYSHIGIDCPRDIVVAHELGHNMGLTHSHFEDGAGGTFNFSTGYGVESRFVTVMASPAAFRTDTQVARFSNPRQDCREFVCGVDAADEFGADAARSLNIVKYQIADYFPTTVLDLPFANVFTIDGSDTDAAIAVAATTDGGLSFTTAPAPAEGVDVVVDIHPDLRHIGEQGTFHAVISQGNQGFLQVDGSGRLSPWNGTFEGLIQAGSRPLEAYQRWKVLENHHFDPSLVGQQVLIYVAYQAPAFNDFVYTGTPLVLDIREQPEGDPEPEGSADPGER